jgi:hypothetical protein
MEQAEAERIAREFIVREGRKVADVESVRLIDRRALPSSQGSEGFVWSVCFSLREQSESVVVSPGLVVVQVDDATGRATLFATL